MEEFAVREWANRVPTSVDPRHAPIRLESGLARPRQGTSAISKRIKKTHFVWSAASEWQDRLRRLYQRLRSFGFGVEVWQCLSKGNLSGVALFLLDIASDFQQAVEHFGAFRAANCELGVGLLMRLLEAV